MKIKNPEQVLKTAKNILALAVTLTGVIICINAMKIERGDIFIVGFIVAGAGAVLNEVEF